MIVRPRILWGLILFVTIAFAPSAGLAQEGYEAPPPDSLVLPSYTTSYDRNRTQETWGQDLNYSLSRKRTSLNLTGSTDTQNSLTAPVKSTRGSITGSMNYSLVGAWQMVIQGFYDMNSSLNRRNDTDSRNNKLNLRTQYLFFPVPHMRTFLTAYTEFEQKHDTNRNDVIDRVSQLDSAAVDTSVATRDSSYTTSRNDALTADITWPATRWLELHQTVLAYRNHPTITSFQRSFRHALDSTQVGRATYERQQASNPSDNTRFWTSAAFTRRATKAVVTGSTSSLRQSNFDLSRLRQENSRFDNNLGTFTLDSPIRRGFFLHSEGSMGRNLNEYELNKGQTTLTHDRRALAQVAYMDSTFYGNVNFNVARTRTDLQPSLNGVLVNRGLGGQGRWRRGNRLVLDGNGSMTLRVNDYDNDKLDQDALNSFFSVGCGYDLAPACSTTVHFSRGRGHSVYLDPSRSGTNAVVTTYQMNATMIYLPTRDFSIRQNYLVSAEYHILDYVESQNSLVRSRRIDTDIADTLFSFGIVRLTHNFVFADQGTYQRFGGVDRKYSVASRSYAQTLTATVGAKIAPGVLFLATQSLLNKRDQDLVRKHRTLQNTWNLNLSLQVYRTLSDGLEINGAVRRLGQYVEGNVDNEATTEDDWVAGASIRKAF